MEVFLLAEMIDGRLALDATAKAVTAAASLGNITVLCAGSPLVKRQKLRRPSTAYQK